MSSHVSPAQPLLDDPCPLRQFLADHPGPELGRSIGGGTGDTDERGHVVGYLMMLLDTHVPGWLDRQIAAVGAYLDGDSEPLAVFSEDVRQVVEAASRLARVTGSQPWLEAHNATEEILRDRDQHPERWVPLAKAVETYQRLATKNRVERRTFAREARARGAGRPAARRRKTESGGDGGDDGPGEPARPQWACDGCYWRAATHRMPGTRVLCSRCLAAFITHLIGAAR